MRAVHETLQLVDQTWCFPGRMDQKDSPRGSLPGRRAQGPWELLAEGPFQAAINSSFLCEAESMAVWWDFWGGGGHQEWLEAVAGLEGAS